MLLNNILPGKHLQAYVRFYRIIDFDFSNDLHEAAWIKAYRPRIEHCLQFTPFDNEAVDYPQKKNISFKVALFGQQTLLTHRKVGKRFLNFQVVFQPGVLNTMLRLPMDEFSNVYCEAELFFGKCLHDVNEQLACCDGHGEMIVKVEGFLQRLLSRKMTALHPINKIARSLMLPELSQNMEWFAEQSNLCYRQFDRAFMSNTGIAPKDFRTLVKLDHAYLLKNRNPKENWLSIALKSGFYDYQHLSKSYKKFIGYSPAEFNLIEQQAPERHFGDFEQ